MLNLSRSLLQLTAITTAAISFSIQAQNLQTPIATEQRLKPVGVVNVVEDKPQATITNTSNGPKEIYEKYCTACHTTGAAGSPKLGDKEAWKSRIAQGNPTLYQHAIQGYRLMPAKGTCMTCSDDDIKKTVDYIVANSK